MSNWTEVVWEWLKSTTKQEEDYAYITLAEKPPEPASRRDITTTVPVSTTQTIYSVVSLSQWLPAAFESANAANDLTPDEVEQTERSARESFLQGYSLF
ncbi:hypothetical protein ABBQ38_005587 [Trebouxia sp. C0009 RCD-2024]